MLRPLLLRISAYSIMCVAMPWFHKTCWLLDPLDSDTVMEHSSSMEARIP